MKSGFKTTELIDRWGGSVLVVMLAVGSGATEAAIYAIGIMGAGYQLSRGMAKLGASLKAPTGGAS